MTLRKYLLSMLVIAIVCWAVWTVVLYKIDPFTAGPLGFVLFYICLFFSITTSFAVLGLLGRLWLVRQDEPTKQVAMALRQGVLFAILVIGALVFLSLDIFTWINVVLLIAILAILEFFFLSASRKKEEAPDNSNL